MKRLALLASVLLISLGACTSSKSHSAGPSGMPTDAPGLSRLIDSAVPGISSAHLDLSVNLLGQQLTGGGSEKLSNGKLTGLDITENLPGGAGAIRIIVSGGNTYVRLPASLNPAGKPYQLVGPNSSNAIVRSLAPSLDTALALVTPGTYGVLVDAAQSVDVKGTESVGGVSTTHYSVLVDTTKLPATLPGRSHLSAGGAHSLPIELWVDTTGRPVRATGQLTVQGQSATFDATYSNFNRPVTINAPPPSEVGS